MAASTSRAERSVDDNHGASQVQHQPPHGPPGGMSELSVLSLNCWGLRFFSKRRQERLRAIADRLASTSYDIVALQEIWVESQDWRYMRRVCAKAYPHGKFFLTYVKVSNGRGAFGSGLAVMSKHPIVGMETHMFRLTGTPIFVQQGDWIAGKGCGCVTIAHPQLGEVDVWDTHMGPEIQRTERTFEAYELAKWCARSAELGRHVICTGDFNSLTNSLCMGLLRSVGGLRDSYFDVYDDESASGITCDSPMNTWSHTKKLDELALRQSGKRIDFILYRGPAADTGRLRCVSHQVGFKELVPNLNVSYSDHFSVEAVFRIAAVQETRAAAHEETRADVIECAIGVLQEALGRSDRMQSRHLRWFYLMLGGAGLLVAGNVCASVWLHGASSVGPSLVTSVLLIAGSWAGTTALYSGVVWGEWYKRMYIN